MLKPYFKTRRLLKRERRQNKLAEEEFALRLGRAESHGASDTPLVHTDPEAEDKKEE